MGTLNLTERESTVHNEVQMFRLSQLYKKDEHLFYEVCQAMPFYININNKAKLDSSFANKNLEYLMERDRNEIIAGGFSLIRSISHTETLDFVVRLINNYAKENDHNAVCSYFQYMKFHNKWQWVLTHKMFLNDNLYLNIGQQIENLGGIGRVLSDVLGDTIIRQNGWLKFGSLSKREKQILKMIASGYSRKDIGDKLYISENTVRTHRQKIMRKIDANSLHDIIRFTQAFEMIGEL